MIFENDWANYIFLTILCLLFVAGILWLDTIINPQMWDCEVSYGAGGVYADTSLCDNVSEGTPCHLPGGATKK